MAIAVHSSSPAQAVSASNTSANVTTASFSPPADSVLVCLIDGNSTTTRSYTVANSGTARSWTKAVQWDYSSADGASIGSAAAIYYAVNASAQTNITVTVTPNNATDSRTGIRVLVLTGVNTTGPLGATGGVTNNGVAAASKSLTATATGSLSVACGTDWWITGAPTSSDLSGLTTFTNADISGGFGYRTMPSSGTSYPHTFTWPSSAAHGHMAAAEFLAATTGAGLTATPGPDPAAASDAVAVVAVIARSAADAGRTADAVTLARSWVIADVASASDGRHSPRAAREPPPTRGRPWMRHISTARRRRPRRRPSRTRPRSSSRRRCSPRIPSRCPTRHLRRGDAGC